jgi:DNA-directed RNA polymerase II subunit RPB9
MKNTGTEKEAKMLFCGHCKNLLYPESDDDRRMQYRCAYCRRVETHDDKIVVYTQDTKTSATRVEEERLLAEFASDPTAQRDPEKLCKKCKGKDVACFVNPLAQPTEDMTLYFACANCKTVWK